MHPYFKAWLDIIVHGFVLLPWHIFEWVVSGFDSRIICLPIKRYWSMNGRNVNSKGHGVAVPLGILEVAAAIATVLCYMKYQTAADISNPVAFTDAGRLLAPIAETDNAVVMNVANYPEYLGGYIEERARERFGYHATEAIEFTLLDEDLLKGIVAECARSVSGETTITVPDNFNGTSNCDFISFSQECVCAGNSTPEDHKNCIGTSDQKKILNAEGAIVKDTSKYATCIKHGGLDKYIDTRSLQGKVATNEFYDFCQLYLVSAVIMSICRAVARLAWPGELKKPGAMWVNGIPAGICMLVVSCRAMKLLSSWREEGSLRYFSEHSYMFGHNPAMQWVDAVEYTNQSEEAWNNFKSFAMLGALLNIACSFFSDYSYCNDVTTLAYTKDNLKIVKERARKTKLASF